LAKELTGMKDYHPRRPEKMIPEKAEILEVIQGQKYMTLAMCKDDDPYLATVNYVYDVAQNCFFFHCSPVGKKMDYLKANPKVWGVVVEDRGYLDGECNHAYRSVQFAGRAEILADSEAKRQGLTRLIDALEENPEPVRQRLLGKNDLSGVGVVKIHVLEMTGKMNPAKKEEVVS